MVISRWFPGRTTAGRYIKTYNEEKHVTIRQPAQQTQTKPPQQRQQIIIICDMLKKNIRH